MFFKFLNVMILAAAAMVVTASAQIVVTPNNTHGWTTADTRQGGEVNFVVDSTAPSGVGALELRTDATTTAKAQYMHDTATALSDITELSYYTRQVSGPVFADPSYQLPVCLGGVVNGSCIGFTTLVYEPYENGTVIPNAWQSWDVYSGQLWSSRSYTDGGSCTVVAGGGGAPFYNVSTLSAACPNAVAVQFGVNVGSNNPSYDVYTDLVNFNGTTYDFEPYQVATNANQCKNGGWQSYTRGNGSTFRNQGDCIQYVNTGR